MDSDRGADLELTDFPRLAAFRSVFSLRRTGFFPVQEDDGFPHAVLDAGEEEIGEALGVGIGKIRCRVAHQRGVG